ncbi:hypothetical protein [Methyloceanibacter sp.]|uniref:hypothetical protein n=1 Tax=Methyloceanibacter sp. TaxID=1965321 RepID=UPI003D6D5D2D
MAESVIIKPSGTVSGNGMIAAPAFTAPQPGQLMVQPGVEITFGLRGQPRVLKIEDLYVDEPGRPEILLKAQALIVSGVQRMEAARRCIAEDEDPLGADYQVTLFQGDIPELFYFSTLSEGFSTLVVAIHDALKGREGAPLNVDQINAVLRCLVRLRDQPFMRYDTALDLIDDLQAVGLSTDPPEAAALAEILLDEGDS